MYWSWPVTMSIKNTTWEESSTSQQTILLHGWSRLIADLWKCKSWQYKYTTGKCDHGNLLLVPQKELRYAMHSSSPLAQVLKDIITSRYVSSCIYISLFFFFSQCSNNFVRRKTLSIVTWAIATSFCLRIMRPMLKVIQMKAYQYLSVLTCWSMLTVCCILYVAWFMYCLCFFFCLFPFCIPDVSSRVQYHSWQ